MISKIPIVLNVKESLIKDFERLLEKDSPLKGKENKHVFILAMMTGFSEGHRMKLDKKKSYIRMEYLSEKEKSVIKAIALHDEKNLEVLADPQKIYSIAEEYASGGIKYLKEAVFTAQHGSYIKRLETKLVDEVKKALKTKA